MDQQPALPDEFYIPASVSLQERRTHTLKSGDLFGVFDACGNVLGSTDGLYFRDTRHLSDMELRIGGQPPMLLSSTLRDDNGALICDLANPDLYDQGQLVLDPRHGAPAALTLPLERRLLRAALGAQLRRNHDSGADRISVRRRLHRPVRIARHESGKSRGNILPPEYDDGHGDIGLCRP